MIDICATENQKCFKLRALLFHTCSFIAVHLENFNGSPRSTIFLLRSLRIIVLLVAAYINLCFHFLCGKKKKQKNNLETLICLNLYN